MSERMQMQALIPKGFQAVYALERYVRDRVDHQLYELIKLRASMLNGCAYCVDMHATELITAGEHVRRVVAVAAWRESPFFTARERVAFELTEVVTRLGDHGVPDDVWDAARTEFGEELLADLIVAIASINVWNRIAISSRAAPPALAA